MIFFFLANMILGAIQKYIYGIKDNYENGKEKKKENMKREVNKETKKKKNKKDKNKVGPFGPTRLIGAFSCLAHGAGLGF